jgi:hypothetical protein
MRLQRRTKESDCDSGPRLPPPQQPPRSHSTTTSNLLAFVCVLSPLFSAAPAKGCGDREIRCLNRDLRDLRNCWATRPTTAGMSESIFGSLAIARSLGAWSQQAPAAAPAKPAAVATAPRNAIEARDAVFFAILEAPLHEGETAMGGFARKEEELRAAFAALSVLESRAMQARLSNPRTGDRLAAAFSRLTIERRARLINFLGNARRREAMSSRKEA